MSKSSRTNTGTITATYRVAAPAGRGLVSGRYVISLVAGQVRMPPADVPR